MNTGKKQKGAVAIVAALSLPILIGFAGLALDLGHLYVEKTELQNATDACALAASRELTCDPAVGTCASSFLINAENTGLTVARLNKADFQSAFLNDAQISAGDIKFSTTFSPNSNYISRSAGANPASKYVMCTTHQTGIVPWFMQVLGVANQTVSAQAVATLAPAQTNCAIPIGMCGGTKADPFAGLTVGQWISSKLNASATGSFDWVSFTGDNAAKPLKDLLSGTGACSVPPPPTPVGTQGNKNSLDFAWNTRFGIYHSPYNISSTPDYTGESYTQKSWPSMFNAYAGTGPIPNFQAARALNLAYQGGSSTTDNLSPKGSVAPSTQLATAGADRRLVTVPVMDCNNWASSKPQTAPVLGYACVLMLHPMDSSNGPSGTQPLWLEYRGQSTDPSSPCATSGSVGGPGSVGPLVSALVQ